MADIFGRAEQIYAGGLTSDASWMFWGGMPNGGLGMLVTQMSIQYMQPIRKIFEIGPWTSASTNRINPANEFPSGRSTQDPAYRVYGQPVYYVAGRPEGTLQLGRIAGPVAALGGFYKSYGNICNALNTLFFVSSTGCIGGLPAGQPLPVGNGSPFGGAGAGAGLNRNLVNRDLTNFGAGRVDPYLGWYMNGVVITAIGLAAQAQDMMVTENVQCQYISLRLYTRNAGVVGQNGFVVPTPWTEL